MVLVFGANGNLGSVLVRRLQLGGISVVGLTRKQVDIRSELCIWRAIKNYKPETVINCAAVTDVDWCESNRDEAYLINSSAVKSMALASRKVNSKFIHISTDYVFDGNSSKPYTEDDIPMPLNIYGDSKLAGERNVQDVGGVVCRVQWVLGYARSNYLTWMVEELSNGRAIQLSDQIGAPSEVNLISEYLEMIHRSGSTRDGLFHISSDDYCTRYELGLHICKLIGVDQSLVQKSDNHNFGSAMRPKSVMLDNGKLRRHFSIVGSLSWKSNISNFIRGRYGIQC